MLLVLHGFLAKEFARSWPFGTCNISFWDLDLPLPLPMILKHKFPLQKVVILSVYIGGFYRRFFGLKTPASFWIHSSQPWCRALGFEEISLAKPIPESFWALLCRWSSRHVCHPWKLWRSWYSLKDLGLWWALQLEVSALQWEWVPCGVYEGVFKVVLCGQSGVPAKTVSLVVSRDSRGVHTVTFS